MKFAMAMLAAGLITGCATTPPPPERLTAAPREQLRALPVATSATPATVRVTRDEGARGAAAYLHVSLDGRELAALDLAQFVEFQVDPGDHLLSVQATQVSFLPSVSHPMVQEVIWRPGKTYAYRVGYDATGTAHLFRVAE